MIHRITGRAAAVLVGVLLLCQPAALALEPAATASLQTVKTMATFTRTMKKGCKGNDVKSLQKRLKTLGYYSSTADGKFGSGTEKAVKAFQKKKGLKQDGVVGKTTFKAIYAAATATPKPTPTPSVDPTKSGGYDNQVTLKKGDRGSAVVDLQTALKKKGYFTGTITGIFGSETKDAVARFQRSVGLDGDGVAGNYTLSALYTLLNPPDDMDAIPTWPISLYSSCLIPIEKLTWSQADTSAAFPRKADATVIDVRTGYSFRVRRTGGTLHADVETLAVADTAAFTMAVGSYSWARRPVWVVVSGRRLAASMNCMPHGYDSIAVNGMSGQFCIHFVGSRTHGSGKVDPDHLAAIEIAYEAGKTLPDALKDIVYDDDGGASQQMSPS